MFEATSVYDVFPKRCARSLSHQASYIPDSLIDLEHPVKHTIMLVDEDPSDNTLLPEKTVFGSPFSGRTVTVGQLFPDSNLPDLVFAMTTGELIFFANQGLDEEGKFGGFTRKGKLQVAAATFEFQDVQVESLAPCTQCIVTAVMRGYRFEQSKNVIFTTPITCPINTGI